MALPDVCFSSNQGACNCTSAPPELPPRPNFYQDKPTTTTPELTTNHTTDPTTITTPTNPTAPTEGTSSAITTTCSLNDSNCGETSPSIGLIIGCTCGAVIFILLLGLLIWYLWKNSMCCFRPQGICGPNGSQAILPVHEEKQVELVKIEKIEKKGTVILTPTTKPHALQEEDGPPSGPPAPNTAPNLTPVESKGVEALPSPIAAGRPDSSTSTEKKKKKKKNKGGKSNRVTPEPNPKPESLNP